MDKKTLTDIDIYRDMEYERAIWLFKKWGSIGGKTSASKMTVEQRRERARKGGKGKRKTTP